MRMQAKSISDETKLYDCLIYLFIKTNDKRICYTVIVNTVNQNQRKQNKHMRIKEGDLEWLFGHLESV